MANLESRIILKDGFSETSQKFVDAAKNMKTASEQAGAAMDQEAAKAGVLSRAIDRIKGLHKSRFQAVGLEEVTGQVESTRKRIERLTNKSANISVSTKVRHADIRKAKKEAKELRKELKDLTGQKYDVKVNVDGKEVKTLRQKLKGGLGGVASIATGNVLAGGIMGLASKAASGIGAGVSQMFNGAMEQQAYQTNMMHFMGGDTEGVNDMMSWAKQNARTTQFSSGEVLGATSRAIQVTSGDTVKAKELTQMAEDMASLTPGKSISDAMEALADAQQGEFERMKEFGFTGSKEAFEAAGGDIFKVQNAQNGKTIGEMFSGGTAAGGQTAAAKIGTITGAFEDSLTSAGIKIMDSLNPALDWLIDKSDGLASGMESVIDWISGGLSETFSNVITALQPFMPLLSTIGGFIGTVLQTVLGNLGDLLNDVILPAIGWIGEALQPAFQAVIDQLKSVGDSFKSAGDRVRSALDAVKNAFNNFRPGDLWNIIKSWFTGKKTSSSGSVSTDWMSHYTPHKRTATGGLTSGLTWVNDAGGDRYAEAWRFPNGTTVFPAGMTRRMIASAAAQAGGKAGHTVTVNIDARGSSLSPGDQYRMRKLIVQELVDALDNV